VKYVVLYESADDVLHKVPDHIEAHRARWAEYAAAGTLLMIGPYSDPSRGAMAVFTTREAATSFVEGDPFVVHGLVASWRIEEWLEVLVPEA
jgi:uncharacterized protein YciI